MKVPLLTLTIAVLAAGVTTIISKPDPPKKRNKNINYQKINTLPLTSIEWKDTSYYLGKVTDGAKVEILYTFKNTGNAVLIFNNIQASCGCTIPEKPEKAILPGDTGTIKAMFNSKGRIGTNHKVLTAYANIERGYQELIFDVEVEAVK